MASISLPAPGTELGPCIDACVHSDCKATRRMATSICPLCEKEIGYDAHFFGLNEDQREYLGGEFAHFTCLHNWLDANKYPLTRTYDGNEYRFATAIPNSKPHELKDLRRRYQLAGYRVRSAVYGLWRVVYIMTDPAIPQVARRHFYSVDLLHKGSAEAATNEAIINAVNDPYTVHHVASIRKNLAYLYRHYTLYEFRTHYDDSGEVESVQVNMFFEADSTLSRVQLCPDMETATLGAMCGVALCGRWQEWLAIPSWTRRLFKPVTSDGDDNAIHNEHLFQALETPGATVVDSIFPQNKTRLMYLRDRMWYFSQHGSSWYLSYRDERTHKAQRVIGAPMSYSEALAYVKYYKPNPPGMVDSSVTQITVVSVTPEVYAVAKKVGTFATVEDMYINLATCVHGDPGESDDPGIRNLSGILNHIKTDYVYIVPDFSVIN